MSEKELKAAPEDGSVGDMPAADVKFLMVCLQNTSGGSIVVSQLLAFRFSATVVEINNGIWHSLTRSQIDKAKVASILGFSNVNSVSNKVLALKKKYDLPFGTTAAAAIKPTPAEKAPRKAPIKKASSAAGPTEVRAHSLFLIDIQRQGKASLTMSTARDPKDS